MTAPQAATDKSQFEKNKVIDVKAEADRKQVAELMEKRTVEYKSLETGEKITLTMAMVRNVCATPTRRGDLPDDKTCYQFMKLCAERRLNPFVGDAYLIGYLIQGREPAWNLIVAHSALLKRAELSGQYNGLESGVIVVDKESGLVHEMQGDFYLPNRHELVGAWAKAHRKDRDIAEFDRLNLDVYDTKRSRWASDPAGMIVKVAEASVLRRAFPGETAGLYVAEEMDRVGHDKIVNGKSIDVKPIDTAKDRLSILTAENSEPDTDDSGGADRPTGEPSGAQGSNGAVSQPSDEPQESVETTLSEDPPAQEKPEPEEKPAESPESSDGELELLSQFEDQMSETDRIREVRKILNLAVAELPAHEGSLREMAELREDQIRGMME